jgi:iron complex outermembrane receptor protein
MPALSGRSGPAPESRPAGRVGPGLCALLCALPLTAVAQQSGNDQSESEVDAALLSPMVVVGTALKVEAPLVETPRPASVVQREELEERKVQRLDEVFRYRAGVLSGLYGADNDTDWFKIRGFDQATYQDGLRIYREGFYQWVPEPFGIQRVELLKGPSSILYGEAPPGGVINIISKRPTAEPQSLIEVQAGNRDHRLVGFDTAGPATETGDVRYRLVGLFKERDGDLDFTHNERYYIAPSLEVDLGEATRLTVLTSFQKDDGVPTNPFKLPYGTIEDTPYGKVEPSTNLSEPDYDRNDRTQWAVGYEIEHDFNDTWTLEQNLRYSQLDLFLRSTYALFMQNDREAVRGLVYRDGRIDSLTVDNRLVGRWYTDRTENTLLVGVDYQNLGIEGREADPFPFGQPIDIFDPEYGNFTPVDESDLIRRDIDKQQLGLYLQHQLRLDDRWVLLGGVRYDQAETDNVNRDTGTNRRSDDNEFSFSGGAMYLADNGLSPYVSYTESFDPQGRVDQQGRLYEPLEGRQWEVGVKYAPATLDGYVTAAAFDIKQTNALISGPGGGFQIQAGEKRSRGFELESVAYLTPSLKVIAAYTYTDTTVDESTENRDARASLIPRHMASAWLGYDFSGALKGLMLGGGVRYVGESVDGDLKVPSYTVFDLVARYDFADHWRAQLNVNNVADEVYVASCDYWCYYGESRSVIGSLSYRW